MSQHERQNGNESRLRCGCPQSWRWPYSFLRQLPGLSQTRSYIFVIIPSATLVTFTLLAVIPPPWNYLWNHPMSSWNYSATSGDVISEVTKIAHMAIIATLKCDSPLRRPYPHLGGSHPFPQAPLFLITTVLDYVKNLFSVNTNYFTLTHPEILFCSRFKNQNSQLHLTWKDFWASTGGSLELPMLAVGRAGEKIPGELRLGRKEAEWQGPFLGRWLFTLAIVSDIRFSDYTTSHSGGRLALRFKSFSVRLAMASYENQRTQLWIGNWSSTAKAPALTATTS